MNLASLVRHWGKTRPDHQAVVFGDTAVTWSQLDASSDAVARGLAARGVRKGDRVGLLGLNRLELVDVILGTVKLGALCVPLNFRLTATEIAPMIIDAGPRVVVVEDAFSSLLETAAEVVDFEVFALDGSDHRRYESLLDPGTAGVVDIGGDDPAFICYTSGTTGVQKGAVITHRSALAPGIAQTLTHGFDRNDRVMCSAPLVYTGSVLSIFVQLVLIPGATMILLREYDPEIALDTFEREQVTATTTVPVIWERMAALSDFDRRRRASWTFAGAGGAPVSLDLLDFYRQHGIPLTQVYGLTEASGMVAALDPAEAATHPAYAGLPLAGTQVSIGHPGDAIPAHEVGEIMVRGEHVMSRYWNNRDATDGAFVDGWLRTGDLGLMDEGGFVKVVDRSKDMLISGGLNVYPAEIEKALHQIDGLLDCAVIGVPDDRWGEVPIVVFYSGRESPEVIADIAAVSATDLAKFKRPTHAIASAEPLPRTFSGKLAKPELRKRFARVPDDAVPVTAPATPS